MVEAVLPFSIVTAYSVVPSEGVILTLVAYGAEAAFPAHSPEQAAAVVAVVAVVAGITVLVIIKKNKKN